MTTEEGNRYFNPENTTHSRLVDAVVEVLRSAEGSTLQTPTLAEKIDEETGVVTANTARSLLYYAREYITEHKPVETEKKAGSGAGDPAWEWRLIE